ncbi:hypothetical protein [Actinacidiphila sp. ITFR-21]|nr:hypothetical protein [Streptomyces sp. ITFR-21]WNI18546.1 hypothetical protein RLT57_25455 [Streptomyces sp. ITFR-21]
MAGSTREGPRDWTYTTVGCGSRNPLTPSLVYATFSNQYQTS